MPATHRQPLMRSSKDLLPEFEREQSRSPALGYEPVEDIGFIRYLEHGYPTQLARWHYHDEFELHFITQSAGRFFVGDHIGHFEPGHLVLVGPRVPHNWISEDVPTKGYALRDRVLQFSDQPLRAGAQLMPELRELEPLLSRASHGIEFHGIATQAQTHLNRIQQSHGVQRLIHFCEFLLCLMHCRDYQLLSYLPIESQEDDDSLNRINALANEITNHIEKNFSVSEVAQRFGMSESTFSRFFRKATGNTFTDFVIRVRVSKACHLLAETDTYITNICYDVGFNNLANFNRRFLQHKGVTPKTYRQMAQARLGKTVSAQSVAVQSTAAQSVIAH